MMKKITLVLLLTGAWLAGKAQTFPVEIYGNYYLSGKQHFACADMGNNFTFDLGIINGVNGVSGGYLDHSNGTYIFDTNLGSVLINVNTGQVIDTIESFLKLNGSVYNSATNDVYGVFWNGSAEKFAHIDLDSEIVDSFGVLAGVTGVGSGMGYLDPVKGYYITKTNIGVVVIDIHTGTIVKSFMPAINMINVVYDPTTNDVYGVFYNAGKERFARIDLDSTNVVDSFAVLTGVNGVTGGQGYDPETGTYVIATNLGVIAIDRNTGTIIGTLTNSPASLKGVTCRKLQCPIPTATFTNTISGLTATLTGTPGSGVTIHWNFGDGDTAVTDTSPVLISHTYQLAGTYYVCATSTDSCGHAITYCDSLQVPATGISQVLRNTIQVYPNPTNGELVITGLPTSTGALLHLYDLCGAEVLHTPVSGQRTVIDLQDKVRQGMYLLRMEDHNGNCIHQEKLMHR